MAFGTPNYLFESIYDITPDFFIKRGVCFVMCDIDNTLVTYDDIIPPASLVNWFDNMKKNGVNFAFVSNNEKSRVETFNRDLGYPFIAKAKKPLPFSMKRLLKENGIKKNQAAVLGDQVLTDSMAAASLGVMSINVPPIKDRTGAFFKFKRRVERLFMRSYWRKHPESQELCRIWHEKTGNRYK